ncbi:Prim_Pol domain containing protein [uncultured Caudovirales phage]|uniref:Prim_Pol domain containing protein n=1 Tax=uncultured Caudovirales phage TaxID=2100421 RepID=A0A6J5NAP2_9CAUD|nr:Prim_Pol domain containing protein [uncultured Caudovirales phage]
MSLTQSAEWLAAEMGLPVFPCDAQKRPMTQHGFRDATKDPETIRRSFRNAAMIGIPTGEASGFFVLDLDCKNGAQGLEWLAAHEARLPQTRRHRTRSGGVHLLFAMPAGRTIRNSASRVGPGVDVRGSGGYIIAPPSDGYDVVDPAIIAEAPAWLLDLIDPPRVADLPKYGADLPKSRPAQSGDGTAYGIGALEDATSLILSAPDGAKFDTLNRQAFGIGQLVGAGELAQGPAITALRSALEGIRHRCEDFPHAEKGLRIAFEQGMAQPRQAPAPRLVRRVVEEYAPTRPEPPPLDHAPDHWSAEPDFEPDAPQVERVAPDAPGTGLPLVYFQDVEPALSGEDFLEGVLIRAAMSVFYGPSNCGKTFFACDLALHVAYGKPWNGREVTQGGVIYCAMEGAHGIRNRVTAWARHYGLEGAPIPFAIIPVALNLQDPEADTSRLIEAIETAAAKMGCPVALVVMDTLSRALAGGNENSPEDMGALVMNSDRIRQATGAHVAWIHHSGKDQAQGARGHSLLRAATDTEIEISRLDSNSPSVARVTKQRELEIDGAWTFSLERVELGKNHRGKPVTSCIVTPAETMAQEARASLTNGESMALRILHDVMALQPVQPPYQAAQAGVQCAASKHAWREAFFARSTADSHEAKKKAFNRAAEGLSQKGKIGVHHDLVWAV